MTSPSSQMNGASVRVECTEPEPVLDEWCIYRVPSKLRNVNKASYTPQLLSIGPFHYGSPNLKDMQSHKQKYYEKFLLRCSKNEAELKALVNQHQDRILSFYAGYIECRGNFMDMILVDACFIIELFITDSETENHHILRSPWMRKAVVTDLILFENQIPYYFLEKLYDFAEPQIHVQLEPAQLPQHQPEPAQHQFLKYSCNFFKEYYKKDKAPGVNPKHFTDLVRDFVCTKEVKVNCFSDNQKRCKYDVRKLKAAGVKFTHLAEPFVIKELSSTRVKLPSLTTKELKLTRFWATYDAESVIRNIMALEQLIYPEQAYVCSYFLLLSQLVNTVQDIDLLIKDGVVENLLGSNKSVEKLINSLCVHIVEHISCYFKICDDLNEHYETSVCNRRMAKLKQVYFKDLWTGSATILGFVVLIFSIVGTINSLTSHRSPKSPTQWYDENNLRLRLFPFSLKDKAKDWLYKIRVASITSWDEMNAAFLKKYIPPSKRNALRNSFMIFQEFPSELFHESWERFNYMEQNCLNHDVKKWLLLSTFYNGSSHKTKRRIDNAYQRSFMEKIDIEAEMILDSLAETSKLYDNQSDMRPVKEAIVILNDQ
ncbi:UPF0481 protein At3g47200-like [Argentina anserina]|uniref:UPF0481 protein At3g47200-like n=1 Tax=Argentina anserina TaxID=57926 RepID=UPI0021764257|nr:UPF0481 protein At3g47200-like [Potentilla anserina]